MHRWTWVVILAGCRLHFDELPADATPDAAPVQLVCNTPVRIADGPNAASLATTVIGGRVIVSWVDSGGNAAAGTVDFVTPDAVTTNIRQAAADTGYGRVALGANASVIAAAYTQNGTNVIELLDRDNTTIAGPTPTPVAVVGSRAVTATGNSATIAAVSGNDTQAMRGEVVPVHADGTLGTPLDTSALAVASSIVNVGDRLAVARSTTADTCVLSTLDLDVTSHGANAGWGTAGQCTQASIAYSPGRSDVLLVRHDMTDGDLNHVIATRSGDTYTIPVENRLRNPGNEPRPIGVADGYWVSYETGGTLEAAHVDFAAVIGTVVPLGPLTSTTAHDTFVAAGEPYAIWLENGLELVHLCP